MYKRGICIPVFTLLILFTFSLPVNGQAFMTETGHVQFTSEVPLHTFTGRSDHLVGKINVSDSTVDFYVDLATLDTGNSKRDKDMRETLEVETYPFAEFFGKIISDFDPEHMVEQQVTVRGDFKVHGVSNEVEIEGTITPSAEGLQVKASWIVNLDDYNIEPPGILFYRVDEEQDVRINALLTPIN